VHPSKLGIQETTKLNFIDKMYEEITVKTGRIKHTNDNALNFLGIICPKYLFFLIFFSCSSFLRAHFSSASMFFWVSHNFLSFTILLTYLVDIALSKK